MVDPASLKMKHNKNEVQFQYKAKLRFLLFQDSSYSLSQPVAFMINNGQAKILVNLQHLVKPGPHVTQALDPYGSLVFKQVPVDKKREHLSRKFRPLFHCKSRILNDLTKHMKKVILFHAQKKKIPIGHGTHLCFSVSTQLPLGQLIHLRKKRERTETKHDASVITVKCIAGLNVVYH